MLKKRLSAAVAGLLLSQGAFALSTGDLAFTSFNAAEDGWSMVTFVNIAPGSTVYFTDNEWNGSAIGGGGAFNAAESYHQWVSGAAAIAAGTVIRFSAIDNATTLGASAGTLSRATVAGSTNYGISQAADTVYAYLGSAANTPTTFLAAISSGVFNTTAEGFLTNTGLVLGGSAIQLSNSSDFAQYNGVRSGMTSFAQYQPLVGNLAQWADSGNIAGAAATLVPNTTAFTITPVPEPESYALFLAGIGLVGVVARRRRND